MKTISEKCNEWYSNIEAEKEGYMLISRNEKGNWGTVECGMWESISSLTVITTQNELTEIFYQWDINHADSKRQFIIMIKDGDKLILRDEKKGHFSFGLNEKEDDLEKILILITQEDVNMIIGATKDADVIEICFNFLKTKANPIDSCIKGLFKNLNMKTEAERMVVHNVSTSNWYQG